MWKQKIVSEHNKQKKNKKILTYDHDHDKAFNLPYRFRKTSLKRMVSRRFDGNFYKNIREIVIQLFINDQNRKIISVRI